jgi:hypothetical protein
MNTRANTAEFFNRIGHVVQEAIEDHEERCHIPPPPDLAKSTEPLAEQQPAEQIDNAAAVPATTIVNQASDTGKIYSADIAGTILIPAKDQAEERRKARLGQIEERLAVLGGQEADNLLPELDRLWAERMAAVHDYRLRQVASRLIEAKVDKRVWFAIFFDAFHGDGYEPGDEQRFLHPGVEHLDDGSGW